MIAVTTLVGSLTVQGTSQPLGNELDHQLLTGLRDWADVVLVGAGTVRVEDYSGVGTDPATAQARRARGQSGVAPIAVVSRELSPDPASKLFTATTVVPLVLAPQSSLEDPALAGRREELVGAGAHLLSTGSGSIGEIVGALRAAGYARITCEGGPGIYRMVAESDLVDVLHLTVDPLLHLPVGPRLLGDGAQDRGFSRRLVLEHHAASPDGTLFLRYRRVRGPGS